jgi:hypothetical protein
MFRTDQKLNRFVRSFLIWKDFIEFFDLNTLSNPSVNRTFKFNLDFFIKQIFLRWFQIYYAFDGNSLIRNCVRLEHWSEDLVWRFIFPVSIWNDLKLSTTSDFMRVPIVDFRMPETSQFFQLFIKITVIHLDFSFKQIRSAKISSSIGHY